SSRFDQALFSKYLHNDNWTISSFFGSSRQGKQIVVDHKQTKQQINFIDAMNYTQPTDLASFAKDFGNKYIESKGLFPYECITFDNYNQELIKSQPFPIKAFDSMLKNKTMSDDDYLLYLSDAKNYAIRWDYLKYCDELDTQIMIQPLDNLINWFYQYNVDMLSFMSLAANANAINMLQLTKILILTLIILSHNLQSEILTPKVLSQNLSLYLKVIGIIKSQDITYRTNKSIVKLSIM
ncbi:MAG: hypothetical protein EZS28_042685, partial [Streblomastix strix]